MFSTFSTQYVPVLSIPLNNINQALTTSSYIKADSNSTVTLDFSSTFTYDTANIHPTSTNFFRLQLLPLNNKFISKAWKTTEITDITNTNDLYIISNYDTSTKTETQYSIFCKTDTADPIDYVLANPTSPDSTSKFIETKCMLSSDDCSGKYCSFSSVDNTSSCTGTNRVFENRCIPQSITDLSSYPPTSGFSTDSNYVMIYTMGGLYYSHQIVSPDLQLSTLLTNTNYVISFWYYIELNVDYLNIVTDNEYYIFYSENVQIYVKNKEVFGKVGATITSSSFTKISQENKHWYNFIIYSNGSSIYFSNGILPNSSSQVINSTNSISNICFTRSACSFSNSNSDSIAWLAGYYRDIEVYQETSLSMYRYNKSFFNNNLTGSNAMYYKNPRDYPFLSNLKAYYALNGVMYSDAARTTYETTYVISNSVSNDDSTVTYTVNTAYNYADNKKYNFGFIFETLSLDNEKYYDIDNTQESNLTKDKCQLGYDDQCALCTADYTFSHDGKFCAKEIGNYVFKSPRVAKTGNLDTVIKIDPILNTNILYFSVYLKAHSVISSANTPIFVLGDGTDDSVEFGINNNNKIYLTAYAAASSSSPSSLVSESDSNTTDIIFGRWVNLSFYLTCDATNITGNVFYDYKKIAILNSSFSSTNILTMSLVTIKKEYLGYISNIKYQTTDLSPQAPPYSINLSSGTSIAFADTISCLSTVLNNANTSAEYYCVKDYEYIDTYCYSKVFSNIFPDLYRTIQLKTNNVLFRNKRALIEKYHFGINILNDLFNGINITPILDNNETNNLKLGFLREFTCTREDYDGSEDYSVDHTYVARAANDVIEFSIGSVLIPSTSDYNTYIYFRYYTITDDLIADTIKLSLSLDNSATYTDLSDKLPSTTANVINSFYIKITFADSTHYNIALYENSASVQTVQSFTISSASNSTSISFKFTNVNTSVNDVIGNLRIIDIEEYVEDNITTNMTTGNTCTDAKLDCLIGNSCSSNNCVNCWPGYKDCDFANNTSPCSYLSKDVFTVYSDANRPCNLDYLNLMSFNKKSNNSFINDEVLSINLTPVKSAGYTLGFWVYIDNLTNRSGESSITLQLDEILTVKVSVSTSNIVSYQVYLYNSDITDSTNTNLSTITDVDNTNNWVYVKVGISQVSSYKKTSGTTLYNGFTSILKYDRTNKDYKSESKELKDFWKLDIDTDDYLDYQVKKIFNADDNFVFKIKRDSYSGNTEFISMRNIVVFNDYINSKFEGM